LIGNWPIKAEIFPSVGLFHAEDLPSNETMTRIVRRWGAWALLACLLMPCAHLLAADELVPTHIAQGVYAFIGANAELSRENLGFIGNSGFLVGPTGVIVIDTGTSRRHGQRMLAAIAKVTDKPVVLVILTHAIQEFLFGNAAFEERGIPILAHTETAKLMRARCDQCLQALRTLLGEELEATRLVLPSTEIDRGTSLEAGGRQIELLHFGWASTPGDLAVLDRQSGTLFAGGVVAEGRIPEIRDGDFDGWLRALDALSALPIRHLVPGHGPISGKDAIFHTRRYLESLDHSVKDLYRANASLIDTLNAAELPEYSQWPMYPVTHRKNVQHRYLQLEIEDLGGDPRSTAQP
jgi:glyoxylase-like metal-dependent hydrolase (beta-lactamase superfamily II)